MVSISAAIAQYTAPVSAPVAAPDTTAAAPPAQATDAQDTGAPDSSVPDVVAANANTAPPPPTYDATASASTSNIRGTTLNTSA